MEFLSIIAIVLSVIALSKASGAEEKIRRLEARYKNNNPGTVKSSVQVQGAISSPGLTQAQVLGHTEKSADQETNKESAFVAWVKEDWLLKLGGVLVVMGVLFFLSLAFTTVGAQGKVAIGYLFGITLMVFGFKHAAKQLVGGSAVHLVGATVVLITTYVARLPGYDLFDPILTMFLMFLVSVCISLMAFVYKRTELAHVGLCVSGVVPILVSTGSNNFFGLLMYLAVVTIGVVWLAFVTRWRTLIFLALSIISIYSSMYITGGMGDAPMAFGEICMVIGFGMLFYLTSLFSIFRSGGITGKVDGLVALLNAGYVLMWVIGEAPEDFKSTLVAVIGLVYAIGFFFVYKVTNVYTSFVVYGGVALGMLATSIMIELSGNAEAVALLLIGAGATLLTYYLSHDENVTKAIALFNILPLWGVVGAMSTIVKSSYWHSVTDSNWSDYVVIILAITIYYSLYTYFVTVSKDLGYTSLWVANVITTIGIWLAFHQFVGGGFATVLSIVTYTVIGLVILFMATQENNLQKGKYARIWLGLVAAHVILWDAWQVGDVALGVFICVAIGVLLLSTTFIIKKITQQA